MFKFYIVDRHQGFKSLGLTVENIYQAWTFVQQRLKFVCW